MTAVWELDLPFTDKFILLAFADHADDSGYCFPSYRRIGWKCGVSEDTIRRCVARFKETGVLQVLREGAGRGKPPQYRIHAQKGSRLPTLSKEGSQTESKGSQNEIKGGTAMLPEPSLEPPLESSESSGTKPQIQPLPSIIYVKRESKQEVAQREAYAGAGPSDSQHLGGFKTFICEKGCAEYRSKERHKRECHAKQAVS